MQGGESRCYLVLAVLKGFRGSGNSPVGSKSDGTARACSPGGSSPPRLQTGHDHLLFPLSKYYFLKLTMREAPQPAPPVFDFLT